jgi:hypothetical protein
MHIETAVNAALGLPLRLTGGAAGRTRYMYDVSFAARQYHHHMFSSQLMPIN